MEYWTTRGVPARKLLMGIPFYGQSFTLDRTANNRDQAALGVRTRGAGYPGPYTKQSGMMAYYEICNFGKSSHASCSTKNAGKEEMPMRRVFTFTAAFVHQFLSLFYNENI